MSAADTIPVITVVLALGAAMGPIAFGFGLWKISQIFVTRYQFDEYKKQAHEERTEMREKLRNIDENIMELMQRGRGK